MGHFHVLTFTLNTEVYINQKQGSTVNLITKTDSGNNKRQDLQQVIKLQTFIKLFSLN